MLLDVGMGSAIAIAASGIMSATARFGAAAGQLVRATTSNTPSDSAKPVVDMIEARTAFTANVAAFKASDRMLGSLLDILA
ncbi:MAG: flagellar basal body rod C-terminal domain-containing protein [Pseudomonadota bacterium]